MELRAAVGSRALDLPLLGDDELAAARAFGRTLSLDQAMAEAWASAAMAPSSLASTAAATRHGSSRPALVLSTREREVARLLTEGFSDRTIAATLRISVRTANAHVRSLLDKLDLRSRWQVAEWVAAQEPIALTDAAAHAAPHQGSSR